MSGALELLCFAFFIGRNAEPTLFDLAAMWAGVDAFVAAYWILLKRRAIQGALQRNNSIVLAANGAVLLGVLIGAVLSPAFQTTLVPAMLAK